MDPVCFYIGSRPVYWYGVMMALAFLAGLAHWQALGRRAGAGGLAAMAGDLAFWLMVGGIVGARAAYVIANYARQFRQDPLAVFRVDQGGLIFYGGAIGAALTLFVFARWRRISIAELGDFAITALPLGHAFGRAGCFLNGFDGCCYGGVAAVPGWLSLGMGRYPVQVFEALVNLGIYAVLFWFYLRRRAARRGSVMALYLMLYPPARFLLEFLRGDERERLGTLSVAQYISLALAVMGVWMWVKVRREHENVCRGA